METNKEDVCITLESAIQKWGFNIKLRATKFHNQFQSFTPREITPDQKCVIGYNFTGGAAWFST